MKFVEYNITNNDGKSNCVIRSFCKMFNKSYKDVYDRLCQIQKELNCENFNDIEVFETFMKNHNVIPIDYGKDIKVKNLNLDSGSYIVFCCDRDEFYHMLYHLLGLELHQIKRPLLKTFFVQYKQ